MNFNHDMQAIMQNIDAGIAAGRAAAAKPIQTRLALRVCYQFAQRAKMTYTELEALINKEAEHDDAMDEVGEFFCPSCHWFGSSDDAEFPLLRRGGPFSGPLDGATPPEHDDAKCPRCAAYLEDVT